MYQLMQELKKHVPVGGKDEVEPMRSGEDIELLSYHAFGGARTLEQRRQVLRGLLSKDTSKRLMVDFETVCDDAVKACGGLPLSLEVMGGCLGGFLMDLKNRNISSMECLVLWKGALEKLKNAKPLEGGVDNERLWKVLRTSDGFLDEDEQNMFLDIACFFCDSVRYGEQTLSRIWGGNSVKSIELRNLKVRSLVKVNKEDGTVTMHDQLRDMDRNLVRENGEGVLDQRIRLWYWKDVNKLLQSSKITSAKIQGLSLQGLSLEEWGIKSMTAMEGKSGGQKIIKRRGFSMYYGFRLNCPQMRLLNLHEVQINVFASISIKGSSSLQWLCLRGTNITEVPKFVWVCMDLCVLDMSMCISLKKLHGSVGNLVNLLELNLFCCKGLRSLPDSIGKLGNLLELHLEYCMKLTSLPDSIGNLGNLLELNLSGCLGLTSLPSSIGKFGNLSKLHLRYCMKLRSLPDSIGKLGNLLELNLSSCQGLTSVPDSIGNLGNLSKLHVVWCSGLTSLSNSIGNLGNLLELYLLNYKGLTSLPNFIGKLGNLLELYLCDCKGLTSLPDSIGNLNKLLKLNLFGCNGLTSLPNSIGKLGNLSELHLEYYMKLTSLPDSIGNLSNLSVLNLNHSLV